MNKIVEKMILKYQQLTKDKQKRCRYHPSCSNYGLECFQKFGFFKAFFLTAGRILRCNPLFKGGYEPVPKNWIEKLFENDYPN
ncbi:MAG TPA: membrane protein insertion efficiency factor YidD [Acholeplasmataceae bacterium]|jgi:putative membrane protein insertion efficiency factor|nr:membrane protein insertion efficiency factor YidD [Acholeplasmataceae bacterium]